MKPIKQKTAKWFIALIVIVAVVGTLFTFVPMNLGGYYFTSVVGSLNVSSELGAGVYAEYDIDGKFNLDQINRSISTIKGVLEDEGYPGANIFSVNDEKIRIEIGYPSRSETLKDSYSLLKSVGVGVFELRSSSSEDTTYITGKNHVKGVKLNTYNSAIYVVLEFNKEGEAQYEKLLEASDTIYVCMGGEVMTSFSSSEITASSSMPLSFTDYNSARDFAEKVKLGSMEVGFNPDTVTIDTMSSIMSVGALTADPASDQFGFSLALIMGAIAVALVIVCGLIYMIIKHGVFGAFEALALLFDSIIAIIVLSLFEWVELSFSSLIAMGVGYALLIASSLIFASRFEEEYKQGKTVAASLETGFKRSVAGISAPAIALTIIFLVVALVAGGELKVFGLITCIFSVLSLFSSLIMLPGFIKIFEAFNDGGSKPYRLAKREEEKQND